MGRNVLKKSLGIYIHIPFCVRKCKYCDFISFENKENCFNEYVNKIISEIDFYFEKDTKKSKEIDFPPAMLLTLHQEFKNMNKR